jgi:3-hydroxybutyryl-CoA dehydrogenase
MSRPAVACIGAGRMGRGIAVAFAYAGHPVRLLDAKPREPAAFAALAASVADEVRTTLATLAAIGLFAEADVAAIAGRVSVARAEDMAEALRGVPLVFEGVPEIVALKHEVLRRVSAAAEPDAIVASTTSTILVDDLSDAVAGPERFLNAHWLNPAYLVPLVEVSPGRRTDPAAVGRLKGILEGIGKVPVVCRASPGFIVPRIQALAMNEAARMVEEGVATPDELDKAIRYGFGFRFAVLGLVEFIDWGGVDILHHASRYLADALGDPRHEAPPVIGRMMEEGRLGLRAGAGFRDFAGVDADAYRRERLSAFVALLRHQGLAREPVLDA